MSALQSMPHFPRTFLDFTFAADKGASAEQLAKVHGISEKDAQSGIDAWNLYGRADVREALELMRQPAIARAEALLHSPEFKAATSALGVLERSLTRGIAA